MSDILTLAEAKAFVNATDTTHDAELPAFITAITAVIENEVGPVVAREVTETLYPTGAVLFLSHSNVISVTSISEWASGTETALTAEDHDTEGTYRLVPGGMVKRRSGWYDTAFTSGAAVRVVYQAGYSGEDLETIKKAAGVVLAHVWNNTQLGAFPGVGTFEDLPNLAKMLLAPFRRAPMVA